MAARRLVIGNKTYSSWSLRAWLALRKTGDAFEEVRVPLYTKDHRARLLELSPAGKVPIYIDGAVTVWDSLAILEYLAEVHTWLWPRDRAERAQARAIAAEMHSGFRALRTEMPMNCRAKGRKVAASPAARADVERIDALWGECRRRSVDDGPWLFGAFTNADAMYAPVALRFHTYGVPLSVTGSRYVETVLTDGDIAEWCAAAAREGETLEEFEKGSA